MAYITTAERIGIEKGLQQGLLEAISLGLELKFGEEGLRLFERISRIGEVKKLEGIKNAIKNASTLEEVEESIL